MTQPAKTTAGLLPISAAATQKSGSGATARKAPKHPAPRLKLIIRRLPPGLTQAELESALGDPWKAGAGKVDWLQYKPGKVSKDLNKPSRPSRAYIHVVSTDCVSSLSETVRQASFQDARNTFHDPILLGPPSLEFAPYAKTPGSRSRKDARQGTIDQDSDFIAFLESLTQPITKPAAVDSATDTDDKKKEIVMTTPLVQFIKDKKASKSKDNASSKSKHSRSEKESKQEKVQAKKVLQRGDKETTVNSSDKKSKGEKPSKDSAKVAKQGSASNPKGGKSSTNATKETTAASERKRERGNVAVTTKILQRDPGLSTSGGRRRGKGGSTDTASSKNESSRDSPVSSADAPKREAPRQPKNASSIANSTKLKDGDSSSRANAAPVPVTNPPAKSTKSGKAKPPSTAKQAFLKHANPSQGVTEALLESAFTPFGAVTKVEIDKKKGFGYVDFAEPEGLRKAIAASPVSVAQSQVVVLERKENPGVEKSRKGREAFTSNKAKTVPEAAGGAAGAGAVDGTTAGNTGSSRGSRGGRGSRNKGPKGGAGASGKTGGAEAK